MKLFGLFPPSFVIGGKDNPYMLRWHLIPRNRWLNVYLHKIVKSDDDRALHDHPWRFISLILWGGYWELVGESWHAVWNMEMAWSEIRRCWRRPFSVSYNRICHAHRVELPEGKTAWTLVLTGPRKREWGFYCPKGWRRWQEFLNDSDRGQIGKGCG